MYEAQLGIFPTFADFMEFKISLCDLEKCVPLTSNYKPAHHITPITPHNVTLQHENGNYTFAWRSGYEMHEYVTSLPFEYILRYHPVGESTMKELHTRKTVYTIPERHFDPGTEYTAKVYNKISKSEKYNGKLSQGSSEIRWRSPNGRKGYEKLEGTEVTAVKEIVIPICMAVGLISLLLFPVARMKIKKIKWLKTPAPYISPLKHTAQRNLQQWLAKGHVQQMYREEISIIDTITAITAKSKIQECTSDIYSQIHTPYVGPLTEVWAACLRPSSHITATNPCKDLTFLPDDIGDINETLNFLSTDDVGESFVSLDDLEPSFEICKPSEALPFTPNPVCFIQNYCTLNITANGFIPTFCTVQCVPNLELGLNSPTSPGLLNMQIEESTPELDTVTLDNLQLSIEE
ncbi:interleukin 21 receptor, tandem duplicate 2 [Silurus meridionalis]|uniref:interleukin 21 receptor, tandem duplicate 2 n=1 Tax=Silurus meridionalis TaxID=175797 RepID=UPI001EE9FAA3|nr:interleukin 21 receptor, tandem duplicate 2 [Silurus meridionalis]